jgi:hypothetical protein
MVGQGVLRECLADGGVEFVQTIGRSATGATHHKLREVVHQDLWSYQDIEGAGFDACFFCLGVSANGMTEADYERVTYGITVAAAETLYRLNPAMTFVYVSGAGTDSSESGRIMWARVKGKTENAILRLPFAAAYAFLPGVIQPLHGIQSRTRSYRLLYNVLGPLIPALRAVFPNQILTTEQIGWAMLNAVRRGYEKAVLEARDIRALANN